ncbi:glycosyltransferase family 2 protein [Actinomycetospora sp. CA-053990]|uniref:glycosyltransferase family 2 protein n=1 Tax=Actinomycetospora sp. CA-053990 TaxID=3239891 RepID=UPI003D8B6DBD
MSRTVSVVICAYTDERWDDVLAAVSSVADRQSVAPHEVIVVVDHNPALRDRLEDALPGAVVVANAQVRGLSGAKNTGVAASTGEVVAFLDDDAVAGTEWVRTFAEGYDDPAVLGVGGLTLPRWTTDRPVWFPEEFDWVVGCTFVGREVGAVRNLLGGNASFRREAFDIAGGFPTHIGRTAARARPLGCEETEFCIRLASHRPGARFVYDPRAVIWHRVPAVREGFRYFRARCYAEGLSKALVARSVGATAALAAERSYAAVTLRRGVVRGVAQAWRGDRGGLARAGAITAGLLTTTAGYAVGTLARSAP